MGILDTFDPNPRAVINPADTFPPVDGFPETVVVTFSRHMIRAVAETAGVRAITSIKCASQESPVYVLDWKGRELGIYLSALGSAGAAMFLEDAISMGGRRFLVFGSCGCLVRDIAPGSLIVPTAAYRDEGTSHHYAPAADFIDMRGADGLCALLDDMGLPYARTRTWTTDAPYRETPDNVRRRVEAGCGVVEMECAALEAVAQFRGVEYRQFLYGADSLAGVNWDKGMLGGAPEDAVRTRMLPVALDIAARM